MMTSQLQFNTDTDDTSSTNVFRVVTKHNFIKGAQVSPSKMWKHGTLQPPSTSSSSLTTFKTTYKITLLEIIDEKEYAKRLLLEKTSNKDSSSTTAELVEDEQQSGVEGEEDNKKQAALQQQFENQDELYAACRVAFYFSSSTNESNGDKKLVHTRYFRMGAENAYDLVYGSVPQPLLQAIDDSRQRQLDGQLVTVDNFVEGAKVSRGPDWKWGDQDQGRFGILLRPRKEFKNNKNENDNDENDEEILFDERRYAYVRFGFAPDHDDDDKDNEQKQEKDKLVQSTSHQENVYRIGALSAHDLVYGTKSKQTQPLGEDQPTELNGKTVTRDNFLVGGNVRRGPEWRFGNQDGGAGKLGMLLRLSKNNADWCWVRWLDIEHENRYLLSANHIVYCDYRGNSLLENTNNSSKDAESAATIVSSSSLRNNADDDHSTEEIIRCGGASDNTRKIKPKFSLSDRWQSLDASSKSGFIECKSSRNSTAYTDQIIDINGGSCCDDENSNQEDTNDQNNNNTIEVTFEVRELLDGIATLGIFKEGMSTERCAKHVIGEVELEDSIGIGIRGGNAFILHGDTTKDHQRRNTCGTTVLGLKICGNSGSISFFVDGQPFFVFDDSMKAALEHKRGLYRIGVSFTKEGQKGFFSTTSSSSSKKEEDEGKTSNQSNNLLERERITPEKHFSIIGVERQRHRGKISNSSSICPITLPTSDFPREEVILGGSSSSTNHEFGNNKKKISFFNRVSYIDAFNSTVGDGENDEDENNSDTIVCRSHHVGTMLSKQVFRICNKNDEKDASSTQNNNNLFEQKFHIRAGVLGGDISIGVVDADSVFKANSSSATSTIRTPTMAICGEKEIDDRFSLGVLLKPEDRVGILHQDVISDASRWTTTLDTTVVMKIDHEGKLSFEVDGKAVESKALDDWNNILDSSATNSNNNTTSTGTKNNNRENIDEATVDERVRELQARADALMAQIRRLSAETEDDNNNESVSTSSSTTSDTNNNNNNQPESSSSSNAQRKKGISRRKFRIAVSLSYPGQFVTLNPEIAKSKNRSGPALPICIYNKITPFRFIDYVRSIDVIGNKRELICRRDSRATAVSREVFFFDRCDFEETITFHGGTGITSSLSSSSSILRDQLPLSNVGVPTNLTHASVVSFGICHFEPGTSVGSKICGETEIIKSISLMLVDGYAALLHDDKIIDAEQCIGSIDQDTTITMCVSHTGELSFKINDQVFCSPHLRRIKFTTNNSGPYRLAVSVSREGQRATLAGGDIPHRQFVSGQENTLTFVPSCKNGLTKDFVSVSNSGLELTCIQSGRTTIFSQEVFAASDVAFVRTLTIQGGLKGGDVCFGLIDEDGSPFVGCRTVGSLELPNSVGLFLSPDRAAVLHADKFRDAEAFSGGGSVSNDNDDTDENNNTDNKEDIVITMTINHGRLVYLLNGKKFQSALLSNIALNGMFRLAVSLTARGQYAVLSDPSMTVNLPEVEWQPGDRFTFMNFPDSSTSSSNFDNSNNNDNNDQSPVTISQDGFSAKSHANHRTTIFSKQVLSDLAKTTLTERFIFTGGTRGDEVVFGFINDHPPKKAVMTNLAGQLELPNSIGVLVEAGRACILRLDKLYDSDREILKDSSENHDIAVTINLSLGGSLSVMINDRNLHIPSFENFKLSGRGRLAVSFSAAGQCGRLDYPDESDLNNNNSMNNNNNNGNVDDNDNDNDDDIDQNINRSNQVTIEASSTSTKNKEREEHQQRTTSLQQQTSASTTTRSKNLFPDLPARLQHALFPSFSSSDNNNTNNFTILTDTDPQMVSVFAPLRIPSTFNAPENLAEYYLSLASSSSSSSSSSILHTLLPQFDYIVKESLKIAQQRFSRSNNLLLHHHDQNTSSTLPLLLSLNEYFVLALYTFELGMMSDSDTEDGSDNFYFVVNRELRNRNPVVMMALRSFLFYFQSAWSKISHGDGENQNNENNNNKDHNSESLGLSGTTANHDDAQYCYRAFPSSRYDEISKAYGCEVFSSSTTTSSSSLTTPSSLTTVVHWPGFSSAIAYSPTLFFDYRHLFCDEDNRDKKPTLLKIQCCNSNVVRNLNEFSSHPFCGYSSSSNSEKKLQEVLFYPGSSFEVVGVTEENNDENSDGGFRVIELKQIS